MLSAIADVCELLPRVSENARNNASIAICSAIFLLECDACSACSACSRFSCALIDPSDLRFSRSHDDSRGRLNARGSLQPFDGLPGTWMCAFIDFQQSLCIDSRVDLGFCKRSVAEQFLDCTEVAPACQQMRGE